MLGIFKLLLNPYYLNIGLLILWGIVILNNNRIRNNKKIFVTFATLQWILISGLRHISIGADTITYKFSFNRALNTSWVDAFNRFINGIFYGAEIKDPGYMFFEKFIGIFTGNYQVYIFIIAIIFMIPFGRFVYKNSREPLMSFLIYSTLFYSFFSLTGHRQTIATALVVLLGYELIKERKLFRFIVLILIASTIHKSAIVFFPFYFIADIKINKKYLMSWSIIIFLTILLRNKIYVLLEIIFDYNLSEANVVGGTIMFTLMMVLINGVAFWRLKPLLKNNPQSNHFLNASFIALLFTLMTFVNQGFMRVQQYYSLFIVLLIPEIIKSFNKKERVLVYFISVSVLMLLFVRGNPKYLFFWQGY